MGTHSDARETLRLGGELRETLEAKEISRSEDMSMSPFRNRLVMFLLRNGAEGAARNWWLILLETAKKAMSSGRERFRELKEVHWCVEPVEGREECER